MRHVMVVQRLQGDGAFEGCTAEDWRAILAQACLVLWHLTAGEEGRRTYFTVAGMPYQAMLDTLACLCPDVIAAVPGYVAATGPVHVPQRCVGGGGCCCRSAVRWGTMPLSRTYTTRLP